MIGPLSWNLIYVKDLESMGQFYRDVLRLPVNQATEHFINFHTGHCTLELMARHDNGPHDMGEARGWQRNKVLISFHVDDMEAAVAELKQRGAETLGGIRPTVPVPGELPAGHVAQYMDPEGNIIEICDEAVE